MVLALVSALNPELGASERTLVLGTGERESLQIKKGLDVIVHNSAILKIEESATGVAVLARKTGSAKIHYGSSSVSIWIVKPNAKKCFSIFKNALEVLPDLRIEMRENETLPKTKNIGLSIRGNLQKYSDWRWLQRISRSQNCEYKLQVSMGTELFTEFSKQHKKKLSELSATLDPDTPTQVAVPKDLPALHECERAFAPWGLECIASEVLLKMRPLIEIRVIMSEITKSLTRKWGLQWPSSYTAQILPMTTGLQSLEATLNLMESQGEGKVLANPLLVTRSEGVADFQSGGEFPFRTGHYKSASVQWKKHGVYLSIQPRADSHGKLQIKIQTEISTLDGSVQNEGIPGLKVHRMSSEFDLESERTVILSGLIRRGEAKSYSGLPWISQIPGLGRLFSSEDYLNEKSELYIFVSPRIRTNE